MEETPAPPEQFQMLPYEIEHFLLNFNAAVYNRNYDLMKQLYEHDFHRLTEEYYSNSSWPRDVQVRAFYTERNIDNSVVVSLYRELYFRHLFSRLPEPSWNDRFLACCNYVRLLEYFANIECNASATNLLALPEQWLWDLVNEFVHQYQETQRWKTANAKSIAMNKKALMSLHAGREAWRAREILFLLHTLVNASRIKEWLEEQRQPENQNNTIYPSTAQIQPPTLLGYFAIVALIRLQVTLGNYYEALHIAAPIDLSPTGLYWTVPGCHLTLFYYVAFAYMMMRRYQDAIRVLRQVVTFVAVNPSYVTANPEHQHTLCNLVDSMYYLIMLCNALSPAMLEEVITTHIQEKWPDKYNKLQARDPDVFRELFVLACPKFFSPFVSEYEDPEDQMKVDHNEPLNRQLSIFLEEVHSYNRVFNVMTIAKSHNNMSLSQFAAFIDTKKNDGIENVRAELLSIKYKSEQLVWNSGPLLSGTRVKTATDLEIYLDKDILHVKDLASQQLYVREFMRQIDRTKEYLKLLASMPPIRKKEVQQYA